MFGCWHSEIPDNEEVLNFICLGSKSYALLIKNRETGKITSLVKCKGFTLNSVENEKKVDYSLYSSYLNDFFNDITQKNVLAQYRRKPIQNLGEELRTHYTKVVFSNAISIKGVINRRSQNYLIKPFGHV